MDIFDIHNVKVEKANAMIHYKQFCKIAKLFRLVELLLAVILFSWISIRLPFVIGIVSDYLRQLFSVVVSPIFIFLIGNVIILTLVVKSGQITENSSELDNAGSQFYEHVANNVPDVSVIEPEEIVYQDKRIVSEVNTKPNENKPKVLQAKSISDLDQKVYRRSQSENLKNNECFLNPDKLNGNGKLRRSETEIGRRTVETPVTKNAENDVVDELSNEEFQKRIEGFIAKQIRFHHEEKLAIVAHS